MFNAQKAPGLYLAGAEMRHNAQAVSALPVELVTNPDFLMGRRYFTSLRLRNKTIELWKQHKKRLSASFKELGAGPDYCYELLERLENELRHLSSQAPTAARIECYRIDLQTYDYTILLRPLNPECFDFQPQLTFKKVSQMAYPGGELKLCAYDRINKDLALIQENFDDLIYLNENEEVLEASTSNVFAVIDQTLVTPEVGAGVLRGLYLEAFLEMAQEMGLKVCRRVVSQEEILKQAKVVGLTNCLRGLRLACRLESRYYDDLSWSKKLKEVEVQLHGGKKRL